MLSIVLVEKFDSSLTYTPGSIQSDHISLRTLADVAANSICAFPDSAEAWYVWTLVQIYTEKRSRLYFRALSIVFLLSYTKKCRVNLRIDKNNYAENNLEPRIQKWLEHMLAMTSGIRHCHRILNPDAALLALLTTKCISACAKQHTVAYLRPF